MHAAVFRMLAVPELLQQTEQEKGSYAVCSKQYAVCSMQYAAKQLQAVCIYYKASWNILKVELYMQICSATEKELNQGMVKYRYKVYKHKALCTKILPHFNKYPLKTSEDQ